MADISKRAARMEEELRDISSKYDKKDAELQVMEYFPSFRIVLLLVLLEHFVIQHDTAIMIM